MSVFMLECAYVRAVFNVPVHPSLYEPPAYVRRPVCPIVCTYVHITHCIFYVQIIT